MLLKKSAIEAAKPAVGDHDLPCHDIRQDRLADLERVAAQVVAVHLDDVEGVQELSVRTGSTAPVLAWPPQSDCQIEET
jgi:hypothetical protein